MCVCVYVCVCACARVRVSARAALRCMHSALVPLPFAFNSTASTASSCTFASSCCFNSSNPFQRLTAASTAHDALQREALEGGTSPRGGGKTKKKK